MIIAQVSLLLAPSQRYTAGGLDWLSVNQRWSLVVDLVLTD